MTFGEALDVRIVDAVAEELELEAGLPAHTLFKFYEVRPRVMLPKMCPAMVVWLEQEIPILERGTTVRFEYQYTIGVSWHEATVNEAVTLTRDPEKYQRLLLVKQNIRQRIHTLASKGLGISEAWSVLPGGSRYFATPREEGLTEGVAFSILVRTTQH